MELIVSRRLLTRSGDDGHAKAGAKTGGGTSFSENTVIIVCFYWFDGRYDLSSWEGRLTVRVTYDPEVQSEKKSAIIGYFTHLHDFRTRYRPFRWQDQRAWIYDPFRFELMDEEMADKEFRLHIDIFELTMRFQMRYRITNQNKWPFPLRQLYVICGEEIATFFHLIGPPPFLLQNKCCALPCDHTHTPMSTRSLDLALCWLLRKEPMHRNSPDICLTEILKDTPLDTNFQWGRLLEQKCALVYRPRAPAIDRLPQHTVQSGYFLYSAGTLWQSI